MKNLFVKTLAVIAALSAVIMLFAVPVSATTTYSYTHQDSVDGDKKTVYSRDVYKAYSTISASTLGINKKLSGITDLFSATDGSIYLLCGTKSRIVVLNSDYTFRNETKIHDESGNVDFSDAKGIFVDKDGSILIADTTNNRVLICDNDGLLKKTLTLPESSLIPDDFIFQPTKIVRDNRGYTYVLCLGSYYGAILYSPKDEFLGFYGANTVKGSVLDKLSYIWDLITGNDEKKSQKVRALPYAFVDLCINSDGYIYTCTGSTKTSGDSGQIRMLSPGGDVILYKRDFDGTASESSNFNFLETRSVKRLGYNRVQNLVAIEVSDDGFIYALDNTYGKIYLYDHDCNLISVFGGGVGEGKQQGTFVSAAALTVKGTDVLVADEKTNSITVFNLTDYGKLLLDTQKRFLKGDYSGTKDNWKQVLQLDSSNILAYRGLAKAYYSDGNMNKALYYSKLGKDFITYDYAHQSEVSDFINSNFIWLFIGAIVVIGCLIALLIYIRKHDVVLIKNEKLNTALTVTFHPFRNFSKVKYQSGGSLIISTVMLLLLFISTALKATESGFLFNRNNMDSYNSLFTLAQTVGLVVLWSVSNWAVCTIFSGKGKLKEVYVCSSYSLFPIILYNFIFLILSHFLTLSSLTIMNSIYTIVIVLTFFIFSVGIITVHEYSLGKFLITGIVTVLFMILIVFIIFMLTILVQQFGNFVYSLFMEVIYR